MNTKNTGLVKYNSVDAGIIWRDNGQYYFVYLAEYLLSSQAEDISFTLPLREEAYQSNTLFPFFDGLIPEGWLLNIATKNWKIHDGDRLSLLLHCCSDCIGAVSIHQMNMEEKQTEVDNHA